MSFPRANHFRKVAPEGIGADPAFSRRYEDQRAGLAELSSPRVKGITTSGDTHAVLCQGLRRKIKQRLLDADITDGERETGLQSLLAIGDNYERLTRWHRNLGTLLAARRTERAERDAARHEATKAALRPAA